ncbi:MAG: hypothetical protein RMH84_06930, partial [Sulfolobales archaeon]|nr:hypothetical protein [Sulfolobales archaeon]
MKKSFREVDLLAQVLYEVVERRRSLDATFKNVCRRMRVGSLEEREELYAKCRKLVSDYVKLRCVAGRGRLSYRRLARMWLAGVGELPAEPYCRLSVSRWLYDRLVNLLSAGEVEELVRSFEERLLWLRLNWLRAPEERVLRELETEGLEFEVHPKIPYMVRVLRSPKPLRFLRSVKEFRVIPQDLASAVCVEFMDLGPGDVVVDMCAAPGLKTSLIAMPEDSAKVMAFDVSAERVRRMKYLLRKSGVQDH